MKHTLKVIHSKKLSKWCKENPAEASQSADGKSMKGYSGRNPALVLEDLAELLTTWKADLQLGVPIVYGLGENRQSNQVAYFFVGYEDNVLRNLGIE